MTTVTKLIPADALSRFLRQHMNSKLLVVAISGTHCYGYPNKKSPFEIKGIHVEPTESIVGLKKAAQSFNWVGEFENYRIDYSSLEIEPALQHFLRGDGSILERILAPRQFVNSKDLLHLQTITKSNISKRFYMYYRNFSKGVLRDYETNEKRSVAHLLSAYRTALTGIHLLCTGEMLLDLMELANLYGFEHLKELIQLTKESADAYLQENNQWINRTVRLHSLLEESFENTELPSDPPKPQAIEEYLLDMRRRFFDAKTVLTF